MSDQVGDQRPFGQPGDQGSYGQPLGQSTYGKGYEQEIQQELTAQQYIGGTQWTPSTAGYQGQGGRNAVLLVSYRLSKPDQEYNGLIDRLKSLESWWHHLESTWLVITNLSAAQLRDSLVKHIGSSDDLLVVDITDDDWATAGFTREATDWLLQRVRSSRAGSTPRWTLER